ncbi:Uncharacterised protein [Streptococcus pneumoniae]|nr:Uncharacterised protein [Streptococcus pneumoniae]
MTSLFNGSPADTALCNASKLYSLKFSTFAINLYSVGVQQSTFTLLSSNKFKYVFGSNLPWYTNPVAPEPRVAKNGLQIHFCQPGLAVAHTTSFSSIPSQFGALVRK